jgi:hypothetical protein
VKCSGPCDQGRLDCPTPMLCQLPEHDEYPQPGVSVWGAMLALLLVVLVALLAGLVDGYWSAK